MRTLIGLLIVAALTLGVIFFWFAAPDDEPSPSEAAPTTTATTTPATSTPEASTTNSIAPSTTSMSSESHVVQTEAEAEEILRQLWFGWFEGIYNEDEDRIREVVATEALLQAALDAFGATFTDSPTPSGIALDVEILRSDEDCLVTYGALDVSAFRGPDATASSVHVMRWVDGSWRFATSWTHRDDLWEEDCEAELSDSL